MSSATGYPAMATPGVLFILSLFLPQIPFVKMGMMGAHPTQTQTLRRVLQYSKHLMGIVLPKIHQVKRGTGSAEVEMSEGEVPTV